jgi:hypothetical protein
VQATEITAAAHAGRFGACLRSRGSNRQPGCQAMTQHNSCTAQHLISTTVMHSIML